MSPRSQAPFWHSIYAKARRVVILLMLAAIIAACSGSTAPGTMPTPVAEIAPTVEPTLAPTATSTVTLTPVPSVTSTSTSTPTLTPLPTPTLPPRPTATPDSELVQAHVFADPILAEIAERPPDYADDFSNPHSGWPQGILPSPGSAGNQEGEVGYADGEYFVTVAAARFLGPSGQKITCAAALPSWPYLVDFVLEVDGHFVTAATRGYWGVNFRNQPNVGGYGLQFTPTRPILILKGPSWGTVAQMDPRRLSILNRGTGTNHLQLIVKGSQMAVFVNKKLAVLAEDPEPLGKGPIALTACNVNDLPLRVQWDNLRVWDLSK